MGIPALFRWLSRKYPSIVVPCYEEKPKEVCGVQIPVDASQPNPNNVEFDNLYLDMNGIIHPCCNPDNNWFRRPQPLVTPSPHNRPQQLEVEMMTAVFDYIDRIFAIVRPRRLLYMAIDGVAPRAKMNQQRSRRFRASKDYWEKQVAVAKIREELSRKGATLPPEMTEDDRFDSNCITPGTSFMARLAESLQYYLVDRLNHDSAWKDIEVILSDASVPGEGEHKIMDFIRKQRASPSHDPNTHHCLFGADADLMMLGLATHEPNFTILREEFRPPSKRCDICGFYGHDMNGCFGLPEDNSTYYSEQPIEPVSEKDFIFIRLPVLREYLEREMQIDSLHFEFDLERAVDDWVFLCFFVGNDFLPHLPSLEIREGAINLLVEIYKECLPSTGGFLTRAGFVNLQLVEMILTKLGTMEDEIFKKRHLDELEFHRRRREMKRRKEMRRQEWREPHWLYESPLTPTFVPLRRDAIATPAPFNREPTPTPLSDDDDDEPIDRVRLYEEGWRYRYYQNKFSFHSENEGELERFQREVVTSYVTGLLWVSQYYYQGCPSWKWFYPFHYAPFASDFRDITSIDASFEKGCPFRPLEQLMGVFPAASGNFLPLTWKTLMDSDSPIVDFYPLDFGIDLNGKKFSWQGVALLPFVDESRLLRTLDKVYPNLTLEEEIRNQFGDDLLFVGKQHPVRGLLESLYEQQQSQAIDLDPDLTRGMSGTIMTDQQRRCIPGKPVQSPLLLLPDFTYNRAVCVIFKDPDYPEGYLFSASLLPGSKLPPKTLKPVDLQRAIPESYRPSFGFWGIQRPQLQKKYTYTMIQQRGDSSTRPWLQMRSFITVPSFSPTGDKRDSRSYHGRKRRSPDSRRRHSHSSSNGDRIPERRKRSQSDSKCDYPSSKKWRAD